MKSSLIKTALGTAKLMGKSHVPPTLGVLATSIMSSNSPSAFQNSATLNSALTASHFNAKKQAVPPHLTWKPSLDWYSKPTSVLASKAAPQTKAQHPTSAWIDQLAVNLTGSISLQRDLYKSNDLEHSTKHTEPVVSVASNDSEENIMSQQKSEQNKQTELKNKIEDYITSHQSVVYAESLINWLKGFTNKDKNDAAAALKKYLLDDEALNVIDLDGAKKIALFDGDLSHLNEEVISFKMSKLSGKLVSGGEDPRLMALQRELQTLKTAQNNAAVDRVSADQQTLTQSLQVGTLDERVESLARSLDDVVSQLNLKDTELKQINKALDTAQTDLTKAQGESTYLRGEVEAISKTHELEVDGLKEGIKKAIEAGADNVEVLQKVLEEKQRDYAIQVLGLTGKLEQAEFKGSRLAHQVVELNIELTQGRQEIFNLKENLTELRKRNGQLKDESSSLKNLNDQQKTAFAKKEQELSGAIVLAEKRSVKRENALHSAYSSVKDLGRNLDIVKNERDEFRAQVSILEQKNDKLKEGMQQLVSDGIEKANKIALLENTLELKKLHYEEMIALLNSEKSQLALGFNQVANASMIEELINLKNEVYQLKSVNTGLASPSSVSSTSVSRGQSELISDQHNGQLQQQIDAIKLENNSLRETVHTLLAEIKKPVVNNPHPEMLQLAQDNIARLTQLLAAAQNENHLLKESKLGGPLNSPRSSRSTAPTSLLLDQNAAVPITGNVTYSPYDRLPRVKGAEVTMAMRSDLIDAEKIANLESQLPALATQVNQQVPQQLKSNPNTNALDFTQAQMGAILNSMAAMSNEIAALKTEVLQQRQVNSTTAAASQRPVAGSAAAATANTSQHYNSPPIQPRAPVTASSTTSPHPTNDKWHRFYAEHKLEGDAQADNSRYTNEVLFRKKSTVATGQGILVAVNLSQKQIEDPNLFAKFQKEAVPVICPTSGQEYLLSFKGEIPSAVLKEKNAERFEGDSDDEHLQRRAATIINMLDNVLAKSEEINIKTSDPFLAEIASSYLTYLQTIKDADGYPFKIDVKLASIVASSDAASQNQNQKAKEIFAKLKEYMPADEIREAQWFKDAVEFRNENKPSIFSINQ